MFKCSILIAELLRVKKRGAFPLLEYSTDPKFSDRQVRANSADPDQTAPRGAV